MHAAAGEQTRKVTGLREGVIHAFEQAILDRGDASALLLITIRGLEHLDQRHRLLAGFTDLLVETLAVRRDLVRGSCRRVEPQDWAIGGEPASVLRKDEVEARARAAAADEAAR